MSSNLINTLTNTVAKLSVEAKAAIAVGAGAGVALGIKELFFSKYKTPGLPDAKNLKGFAPTMTRNEAQEILNLSNRYSNGKTEIQRQHRVLMGLHHPDKGGSSFIATKINEARDFLTLGIKD
ncbi:Mitochondrial import inner membrane translocase subunit tim-14 [Tritrichomonas foetus]|uniref:Mitochondrial import inner membrane translocase subunit tim-14 n=1 Tax=Tritrichomonas foetus TaxID=1144522 RepID=A0A1J4K5S8_9EUKA|nr:Mitochondrial import inner membrane translocase subunit tim-14 [Tritrichomonas foetus]|eukprot:OHT06515.1 Mitochondrial import inner membrane translocase subunit tim-14 [Tritrichomonas foetus]